MGYFFWSRPLQAVHALMYWPKWVPTVDKGGRERERKKDWERGQERAHCGQTGRQIMIRVPLCLSLQMVSLWRKWDWRNGAFKFLLEQLLLRQFFRRYFLAKDGHVGLKKGEQQDKNIYIHIGAFSKMHFSGAFFIFQASKIWWRTKYSKYLFFDRKRRRTILWRTSSSFQSPHDARRNNKVSWISILDLKFRPFLDLLAQQSWSLGAMDTRARYLSEFPPFECSQSYRHLELS